MCNNPEVKLSIITVCRNAEKTIQNTIESIVSQSYTDFEYIVIDGKSTDSTYEIIKTYDSKFHNKGIRYIHISEKDNGIFDAMNKGITKASGEWINFMNADDTFHDKEVLESVFGGNNDYTSIDVIYGDTVRIDKTGKVLGKGRNIDSIKLNMPFCHQSSFTRSNLMKKKGFDLNYQVSDYNFFLRVYIEGCRFYYIERIITDYSLEGYSNRNKYLTYLGTVEIKNDLKMLNKNSLKQKIKDFYFKQLLLDNAVFHKFICLFDRNFSRRAILNRLLVNKEK